MSSQLRSQKLLQEWVSHELSAYLSDFDVFLTQWIMVIFLKGHKPDNFDSHNSLKVSFTNIRGLLSSFVEYESFLESNSPDVLGLFETNLDSTDYGNFTILGLTLYLLYINDLPDDVICNIAIYADDTTLHPKCDRASDQWQQLELASEL